MGGMLDRLSLIFGRPLPGPLNLVANFVWWIAVIFGLTSLWPDGYRGLAHLLRINGVSTPLPGPMVVVPVMIVLTLILFAHTKAIERRAKLTGAGPA